MLHAYCVRRAGDPPPDRELTGVDGSAVELLEAGGLGLWISAEAGGAATLQRAQEHDRVVRAALRSATPLPIRYGTRFADADRAAETLREKREEFLAALERVSGRVEMGIRVRWTAPDPRGAGAPPPAAGPGRAYLEARRREREERERVRALAEEVVVGVERRFAELELPAARLLLPEPGVAGTLAHLVRRSALRRYRERVAEARGELPHLELLLSGPWAPYSFV